MFEPLQSQREFEEQKTLAAKCYTPEIVAGLAKKFGIQTPYEIAAMEETLAFSAWLYRKLEREANEAPKPTDIRKQIEKIQGLADGLNAKLKELNKQAPELIWLAQNQLQANLFWITDDTSQFGHRIVRREHDAGAISISILRADQILEAIEIIGNLARHALTRFKPNKGGRPSSDEALRMWVINAQSYWEKVLGRPFTYVAFKGHGITKAFEFCQEALRPLNPSVTAAGLGTAMRKAIKLGPPRRPSRRRPSIRKNPVAP